MLRKKLIIFFITFLISTTLSYNFAVCSDFPLDFIPNSKSLDEFSRVYGFVLGQNQSLSKIQEKYPDLASKCIIAQNEFNLAFGGSYQNLDKILKMILKDKWTEYDSTMKKGAEDMLSKSVFNKTQAIKFITTVQNRSKGQIESPVIETLLMCNPTFIKKPTEEISRGFKKIYRTKNHSKSKGLDLQIEYPMSWSNREGKRPNIIQFFSANNGNGPASFSIIVKDISTEPEFKKFRHELLKLQTIKGANDAALEIFSEDDLISMAKESGGKNIRNIKTKRVVLDRWPGAMLDFIGDFQRVDTLITSYNRYYLCLYKNYMIFITCGIFKWPWDKGNDFQLRINKYDHLFRVIANSFVIQSQY